MAPNVSATKIEHLLDQVDPDRARDLASAPSTPGSRGRCPRRAPRDRRDQRRHHRLLAPTPRLVGRTRSSPAHPRTRCCRRIVDSSGVVGEASALPGAPPIAGDRRRPAGVAARAGRRPHRRRQDHLRHRRHARPRAGRDRPQFETRGGRDFPIVCRRVDGAITWGVEAIMLSAGTNVEWLRDDLGVIATAAESHDGRGAVRDTGDVWYVPALLGLGTPSGTTARAAPCSASPRHRPPRARACRARGHRPPGADLRRGGRGRLRAS